MDPNNYFFDSVQNSKINVFWVPFCDPARNVKKMKILYLIWVNLATNSHILDFFLLTIDFSGITFYDPLRYAFFLMLSSNGVDQRLFIFLSIHLDKHIRHMLFTPSWGQLQAVHISACKLLWRTNFTPSGSSSLWALEPNLKPCIVEHEIMYGAHNSCCLKVRFKCPLGAWAIPQAMCSST